MAGSNKQKTNETAAQDGPNITERQWYVFAVTSATLTAVAILLAFIWIFGDGFDGELDLKKAQALSPFGVALFAVVTFCTAGWRGSINTRQADQSEREGRAKLLQEGAKLLGETDNPAHVSAGVATLEILITGPDEKLAVQAMNLVADYIQNYMANSHDHRFREETFAALENGARMGREASRKVKFSCESSFDSESDFREEWHPLNGVKDVQYVGGKAEGGWGGDFIDSEKFSYHEVEIGFFSNLRLTSRFRDCSLRYCDIISIKQRYAVRSDTSNFHKCDFSSCDFGKLDPIPDFREGGNYYRPGKEPISSAERVIDWREHLNVEEKSELDF